MGSHSLYLHLLARYPTVIRISCGALPTPPARCALPKHDMHERRRRRPASQPADIHQPVMLFRLTRTSQESLSILPFLQASFLAPANYRPPPPSAYSIHRRDKPPSPVSMPSLHSAPAARHPSRGVRRLCSHRATKDMGKPPILAHPHTTQPTLVQRHRPPSPPASSALQSVGVLRLAYIRLLCPPKVPTAASAPHVTV